LYSCLDVCTIYMCKSACIFFRRYFWKVYGCWANTHTWSKNKLCFPPLCMFGLSRVYDWTDSSLYSQPSLSAVSLCDFSLKRLADINTQNSLSASNPRYCDSASDTILYPGLMRNFYSPGEERRYLQIVSVNRSERIGRSRRRFWGPYAPSSPTSPRSSSSLQSVSTITIFLPNQCLLIT
jgi:hypothetical protein